MKIVQLHPLESALISGLRAQDPKAQKELYVLFSPKMFAVCKRYVSNTHQAEDLLIEGFLKVFKQINHFKGVGSFEGWLRKIFVNLSLDFLRKEQRLDVMVPLTEWNTEGITDCVETDLMAATEEMSLTYLLSLINALEDPYGLVFSLYVLDNFSHKEISEHLGISVANSKSILHRARKQLQHSITNIKKSPHGKVRI